MQKIISYCRQGLEKCRANQDELRGFLTRRFQQRQKNGFWRLIGQYLLPSTSVWSMMILFNYFLAMYSRRIIINLKWIWSLT
jgi:hypothetical protein